MTTEHHQPPANDGPPPVPRRKRVLLVEDEAMVRKATMRMLQSLGYEVIVAHDGLDGLTHFRAEHPALDVVLTDVSMPQMTGLEFFDAIQTINPNVPVVICSGCTSEAELDECVATPRAFLRKPYRRAQLAELLEAC